MWSLVFNTILAIFVRFNRMKFLPWIQNSAFSRQNLKTKDTMEKWLGVAGQKRGRDAIGTSGGAVSKTRASADAGASRFVQCPGCDRSLPLHHLEHHLDHECSSNNAADAAEDAESKDNTKDRLATPAVPPLLGSGAASHKSAGVQITKYCRETRSKIAVSLAQLRAEVPCDLFLNYLDDATAEHVLASLMEASKQWKQHTWWMFDKAYQTPRLAAVYPFTDFAGDADSMKLDIGLVDLPRLCTETLRDVAHRVEVTVNSHLQLRPAPEDDPALRYRILPLPGMQAGGVKDRTWEATYALCNLYRDQNDCVGGHSDRMSSLGPLPIIAALSLGAARRFKFNKTGQGKHQGNSYSIQVPHNSLLVMWPPCQEQWTHEVWGVSNN